MKNLNSTIITVALVAGIGYAAVAIADMKDGMPCAPSQKSLVQTNASSEEIAVENKKITTFKVDKMKCAACPITVSKAMKKVDGVKSVDFDYEARTATVTFDKSVTNVEQIGNASTNAGYPALPVTEP